LPARDLRKKGEDATVARIIPSIASGNPLCLGEELARLGDYPYLHFDIEDGNFLPNITFGMKTIRAIAEKTNAETDAHLMVTHPGRLIAPLKECGVKAVSVQIEALPYPSEILSQIRFSGMKAGLALNLKTAPEEVLMFLPYLDFVLFMTSEPDLSSEAFNPCVLKKIRRARKLLPKEISLWADGGIGEKEIRDVSSAGADTIILGRAVFSTPDPSERLKYFSGLLNEVRLKP
jgi:ribulose-phosphate 3-epimerase